MSFKLNPFTGELDLIGSGDFSNGGEAGGSDRSLGNTDVFDFSLLTAGIERITILSTGNVGIGTTSPSEKLDVNGNIRFAEGGYIDTGAVPYNIYLGDTTTSSQYGNFWIKAGLDGVTGIKVYPRDEVGSPTNYGTFSYKDNIDATIIGTQGRIEAIVIKNNGNVGIGTTSPTGKLNIAGLSSSIFVDLTGSGAGSSRAIRFIDGGTPTKYNWLVGAQYTTDNAFEITPSTTVGGTTFSTPALTVLNTGNVGIGTTSPGAKLDVVGDTAIQGDDGWNGIGDEANLYFGDSSSRALYHYKNIYGSRSELMSYHGFDINGYSGTLMSIQNNGNVGIGTTSPSAKLDIVVEDATTNAVTNILKLSHRTSGAAADGIGTRITFESEDDGGTISTMGYLQQAFSDVSDGAEKSFMSFWTRDSGSITEKMRIDNSGNVGIGTTSPGDKLEVNGDAYVSRIGAGRSPSSILDVYSPTTNGVAIFESGDPIVLLRMKDDTTTGSGYVIGRTGDDLKFFTADVTRMTIDSTGNVGIGTTSPTALLHLAAGTATNPQLKFEDSTKLTTPETGSIEFYDGRFYITNVDHQRAIDRTNSALLETVTVENTTTETTVWTAQMDANSLMAGNIFKIHADGIINNGGPTSEDQVTIRIKVGGNTVATLTPITKNLTDESWHLNANATQRTIGASGVRATHLDLEIGDTDSVNVVGTATIDTTQDMDITITVEWASADASNVFELFQGFCEYKN